MNSTIVIFGATGDLAARLIYPALCRLEGGGHLAGVRLVGAGLERWTDAQMVDRVRDSVVNVAEGVDDATLRTLLQRFSYRSSDLTVDSITPLVDAMSDTNVHYLALPPGLFPVAAAAIVESGLTAVGSHRLVVEKPFGTDGASAAELDAELHRHWSEEQIFRIDHFLGKETVQNLSVMRFANRVIEPLLCATHVDQVQITAAETLGVEGRYRYYDGIGALRDMIQNHLMQLFCLAAMDPPAVWDAEVLRDHKVEVLRSVRHSTDGVELGSTRPVRGRTSVDGAQVTGIASPVSKPSHAPKRSPRYGCRSTTGGGRACRSISARANAWAPRCRRSPTGSVSPRPDSSSRPSWRRPNRTGWSSVSTSPRASTCSYRRRPRAWPWRPRSAACTPTTAPPETTTAYEQLLLDVLEGDHTPFLRVDEVEWAWRILDPVLDRWTQDSPEPYPSGSSGPASQENVMLPGHNWRPETC